MPAPGYSDPQKGLWVEAFLKGKALTTDQEVENLVLYAKALGVSRLYIQVYRSGYSFFNSQFANSFNSDFDLLESVLKNADGLEVHAWLNLFQVAENTNALMLKRLGREALIYDNCGTRIDKYQKGRPPGGKGRYFTEGTSMLWFDPANIEVQRYLQGLIGDLVNRYPKLSGIHLDYVRYPYLIPIRPSSGIPWGLDFGYGATLRKYLKEHKNEFKFDEDGCSQPKSYGAALRWDEYRRNSLSGFINIIKQGLPPSLILSAAVLPWPDRAYLSAFQDWRSWLEGGFVDRAILMAYTRDNRHLEYLVKQAIPFRSKGEIGVGLGTWLFSDPSELKKQEEIVANSQADEVVYFSYGNMRRE